MKVTLLSVVALTTLALCNAADPECKYRKTRKLPMHWADPTDCSRFYRCTNKGVKRDVVCPDGKEYNSKTGKCSSGGRGLCKLSLMKPLTEDDNACATQVSGAYIPQTGFCRNFYICNDQQAYPQVCDAGSLFNATAANCFPDTAVECWQNKCIGQTDGTYLPDDASCLSFFVCNDDEVTKKQCNAGDYFNAGQKLCQPDPDGDLCFENLCAGQSDGTYVKNPSDCHSYFVCSPGKPVQQDCPEDSYFNWTDNNCQPGKCPTDETTTEGCTEETTTECTPSSETTECPEDTTPSPTECTEESTPEASTECSEDTTASSTECIEQVTTECATSSVKCPGGFEEGEFLPYPGNCMLFYICSEGRLVEQNCFTGNYFNVEEKVCTRDINGVCPQCQVGNNRTKRSIDEATAEHIEAKPAESNYITLNSSPILEAMNIENPTNVGEPNCFGIYHDGKLTTHPKDCRKFHICFGGEMIQQDCGIGNYFDPLTSTCMADTLHVCTPSGNYINLAIQAAVQHEEAAALADEADCTCPGGYANGTLLPFPNFPENCDKYYVCVDRRLEEQDCGTGNMFDSSIDVCVPDTDNKCWPADPCKDEPDNTIIQAPQNCTEFYICMGGVSKLESCPPDKWFNPDVRVCEPDVSGNCINPCADTTGIEFLPHPDCSKYFLCNNGTATAENCTVGGFDVTLGYCHKDAVCEATLCVDKDDGLTYPVVSDDSKFYLCSMGVAYIYNCEPGSAYQPSVGVCLPVPNSNCDQAKCNGTNPDDAAFAPLTNVDDTAFCYCRDGGAFMSYCTDGYTFNAELGICYSNAPCDPEICDVFPENTRSQNRNDTHCFCLCVMKQAVIVNCPDDATYNPVTQLCQPNPTVDPNCSPTYCLAQPDYTIFGALNDNVNGFCMCMGTGAVYTPCENGKKFDAEKDICLSPEAGGDCSAASCTNNVSLIFGATGDPSSFCYCVSDTIAIKQSCPNSETFSDKLLVCQATGCDVNFCQTNPRQPFPAPNDPHNFCYCNDATSVTKIACPDGKTFDVNDLICRADPCGKITCANPANDGVPYPAINIADGFCVCQGSIPIFHACNQGYQFDPKYGVCVPAVDLSCNLTSCADATQEHVYPVAAKNDPNCFCYCFSPTVVELFPCPNGGTYEPAAGVCTAGDGKITFALPIQPADMNAASDTVHTCAGGYIQGQMLPYPKNCRLYYICDERRLKEFDCGAGNYYNEYSNTCQPDTASTCTATVSRSCVGVYREGQLVPHSTNERLYYVCANSQLNERDCGMGNYFDRVKGVCQSLSHFGNKSKHMMRTADVDSNVPEDDKVSCVNNDKHSVPSNCSQYAICLDGEWTRRTCPNQRYYNPEERKCLEPRDDTVCAYARVKGLPACGNSTMEQQTVPGKGANCAQYYRCSHGKWRLKSCAKQHFYSVKWHTCLPSVGADLCVARNETETATITTTTTTTAMAMGTFVSTNATVECKHMSVRPNAANCAMYLMCMESEWWYQYCPLGMYFNRTSNYCMPNSDGQCAQATQALLSGDNELAKLTTQPCETEGAVRASTLECDRYYMCYAATWQLQHCSAAHYFNVTLGTCVRDEEGVCAQFSAAGCVDGERRDFPLNCTSYELCARGAWQRASCGAAEAFDNVLGVCAPSDGSCARNGLRRVCRAGESRPLPIAANCTQFYYCLDDSWQVGACLKGHTFMGAESNCVPHASNDRCQPLASSLHIGAAALDDNAAYSSCLGFEDGTAVAHPDNCRRFFLCIAEEATNEQECARGSFFDATLGYCRPNDGSCRMPLTGVCSNATDGGYAPHPDDCRAYYHCSTLNGTQLLYCPEGEYYHNYTRQCRVDHGECRQRPVEGGKCAGAEHGVRFPHERYCNIYYACVRTLAIPVECPDSHQFSAALGHCVYDEMHECENGESVGNNNGTFGYSCGNLTDATHLPDRIDCTRYYVCSAGVALPKRCAAGSYFDSEQLLCILDDGACPYMDKDLPNHQPVPPDPVVCEGKHGYLMPDPANCNDFYVCINGKLRRERCYAEHFFNATIRQCHPYERDALPETTITMMNATNEGSTQNVTNAMFNAPQCSDKPTNLTQFCEQVPQGTSIAEQGDCRHYISCEEDEVVSQRCRNGESYDSLLGFCRQNDGTCLLENGQRVGECNDRHGQLARDTNNCRGYFVCINGQKISGACSEDEYFERTQSLCLKDENNQCGASDSKPTEPLTVSCTGLSETALYPFIHDKCRSYFQCIKGVPKVHECADGLYYNATITRCVKEITECVMPAANLKRAPEIIHTKQEICDNVDTGQYYANIDDHCRSYYICDAQGNAAYTTCPMGELYNSETGVCELARNVLCRV